MSGRRTPWEVIGVTREEWLDLVERLPRLRVQLESLQQEVADFDRVVGDSASQEAAGVRRKIADVLAEIVSLEALVQRGRDEAEWSQAEAGPLAGTGLQREDVIDAMVGWEKAWPPTQAEIAERVGKSERWVYTVVGPWREAIAEAAAMRRDRK